jgi:putative DNA methylase
LATDLKTAHNMSEYSSEERPRERLLAHGPQTLTDADLLAILIRVGIPGVSVFQLARQVIERFGSLNAMVEAPLEEFLKIKGMSGAKAAQVAAALELARRVYRPENAGTLRIAEPLQACLWPMEDVATAASMEFNSKLANSIARFESYNKHLYRPNTYLHKWWARRCGSTFRMILKHFVTDPGKRDYYAPGGLEGKIILDPMMGGGTTLHEAIRLGANVIGADIDPIPVLQARATLSDTKLKDLERAFSVFYETLYFRLSRYFMTQCPYCRQQVDMRFCLHGAVRHCECGPVLLLDSTVLRYESDGTATEICPKTHAISNGRGTLHPLPSVTMPPIATKGARSCNRCGQEYEEPLSKPFYARYQPVAMVGECPTHGLFFKPPDEMDLDTLTKANTRRNKWITDDDNSFTIWPGPKSRDLIRHNIRDYRDLYSSRQLLYLKESIDILPSIEPAARLYLALLVSTSLEFNSMLCGYKGAARNRPGAIRHTFSHHAYSFPYTALENNPVNPACVSGTLQNLYRNRIQKGRRWSLLPKERFIDNGSAKVVAVDGEVDFGSEATTQRELCSGTRRFMILQGSSVALSLRSNSVDYVVTDPPYFDSVQYSDLAAFFRVWLKKLIPGEADWDYDLSGSAVGQDDSRDIEYARMLGEIFAECRRVLRDDGSGRMAFTYHHWSPKAWAALTHALKMGRFVLVERHVVHSEDPISVHISNLKALTHDAILMLAPEETGAGKEWALPRQIRTEDSYAFVSDCAAALGWMLASDLSRPQMDAKWNEIIRNGTE